MYNNSKIEKNIFFHFSIDDVEYCFENLKKYNYASIFQEPFFYFLKKMNTEYKAKFSLFLYSDSLNGINNKYRNEFENIDWLKIGFHSKNSKTKYRYSSYKKARKNYKEFIFKILPIIGNKNLIDRCPRLSYFLGNKNAVKGFKNTFLGIIGLLGADTKRKNYYLKENENNYLLSNGIMIDEKNNIYFFTTNLRLEWYDNSKKENIFSQNIQEDLKMRLNHGSMKKYFTIFTHEWYLYDKNKLNDNTKKIEEVCMFALKNNIDFIYLDETIKNNIKYRGEK